jgi:hypothetical protein
VGILPRRGLNWKFNSKGFVFVIRAVGKCHFFSHDLAFLNFELFVILCTYYLTPVLELAGSVAKNIKEQEGYWESPFNFKKNMAIYAIFEVNWPRFERNCAVAVDLLGSFCWR